MIRKKTTIDEQGNSVEILVNTNYKQSRAFGRCKNRPSAGRQQLTDRRFMSAGQKRAFDNGEEIWV